MWINGIIVIIYICDLTRILILGGWFDFKLKKVIMYIYCTKNI